MTTTAVLTELLDRVENMLRHFEVAKIGFSDDLQFFSSSGASRRNVAGLDPVMKREFGNRQWLYVLWNRTPVQPFNLRGQQLNVTDDAEAIRKFHMRYVTCDVTFALISPSLDLLEAVNEWFVVAGLEEITCPPMEVILYPCEEKIQITPTIHQPTPLQFAYPANDRGTVTALEMRLNLQYPALIRKSKQKFINEINPEIYIQETE